MLTSLTPSAETATRVHVELWLHELSICNWGVVIAMLDEPNAYGQKWGEVEIRQAIDEYSRSRSWRVTTPELLDASGHVNFGQFNDGSGYWLDYDIPLNGAWSDLTAQFEFKMRGAEYALVLHDIHVL